MENIKNIEYLKEIVTNLGKSEAVDVLENISYLLWDNGYLESRFFIDELIEITENEL